MLPAGELAFEPSLVRLILPRVYLPDPLARECCCLQAALPWAGGERRAAQAAGRAGPPLRERAPCGACGLVALLAAITPTCSIAGSRRAVCKSASDKEEQPSAAAAPSEAEINLQQVGLCTTQVNARAGGLYCGLGGSWLGGRGRRGKREKWFQGPAVSLRAFGRAGCHSVP